MHAGGNQRHWLPDPGVERHDSTCLPEDSDPLDGVDGGHLRTQVGIRLSGTPSIAELLYFDEIAVLGRPGLERDEESAKIGYLKDHGVVVGITKYLTDPEVSRRLDSDFAEVQEGITDAMNAFRDGRPWTSGVDIADLLRLRLPRNEFIELYRDRVSAKLTNMLVLPVRRAIESNPECDAVSIITPSDSTPGPLEAVLEITLNHLPVPAEDTPLERVLDFRSNARAVRSRRRLHRWVRNLTEDGLQPRQIEDELERLLDDYREHMAFHRMKCQTGSFRTLVTAPLDVIGNLMKLRFKAAVDAAFSLRNEQLALTEAELKAPGRAVAYIAEAHDQFSS